MVMSILGPIVFALISLLQTGAAAADAGDIFSPAEKAQMEQASNINQRIKVYEAASKRIQQALAESVRKEDFEGAPDRLKLWTALLSKSLEDISANLNTKKKSRALINYEIQIRKSIADTESYKIKAPPDQQDIFDASLTQAETVRKKFVDILFHR
jgi:hypothetical protein